MKLEITCKQATEFIVKREEGKLSLKNRVLLWLHFGVCSFCKLFSKQSRLIGKNAKHIHQHLTETLTPEEKEKIVLSLQQQ
ncbi:MAG TPA: hypothetical protein VG738_03275 [Chitinophagaceae bacterium]|nr:hypothetical protein [Chitinophagaceae bacterium]